MTKRERRRLKNQLMEIFFEYISDSTEDKGNNINTCYCIAGLSKAPGDQPYAAK